MAKFEFWVIKPTGSVPNLSTLSSLAHHDEIFLSPNVRLCGFMGMAHIESEALAKRYSEACAPRLQKRFGAGFALGVVPMSSSDKNVSKRIKKDSDIIKKRLETSSFAPNKAPK